MKKKDARSSERADVQGEIDMSMLGLSCIFPVPDMKKTADFYVNVLGFSAVEYLNCEEPHICLYLDKTEIVLLQAETDSVLPNRELYGYGYDAYLYTNDQETVERDLIAKGVKVVRPFYVTDYQNREFVIEDIDGRWLAIGLKIIHETIYLSGGCFWGLQKYFDQFDGVISTEVGYANGPEKAPNYEEVCNNSGHAETVKVVYDKNRIDLATLLQHYFEVIDPLSVNRQGNDVGIQYRTGIFYADEAQLPSIREVFDKEENKEGRKLAVLIEPLKNYFSAEEYHQKYLDKNPGGYCHIPAEFFAGYSN